MNEPNTPLGSVNNPEWLKRRGEVLLRLDDLEKKVNRIYTVGTTIVVTLQLVEIFQ